MKGILSVISFFAFFTILFPPPAPAADERYVVLFKNDQVPPDAGAIIASAGGRMAKTFPSVGIAIAISSDPGFTTTLSFSTAVDSVSAARLRKLPESPKSTGAGVAPLDDFFGYQWNIRRVKADKAWRITRGSHKTTVAVIDTGVAWNHPDLKKNVVHAACFTSMGTCDWKTAPESCYCSPYPDIDPHGTIVSSIIAASLGDGKMVGVGPRLGIAGYNVFEIVVLNGTPQEFSFDDSVWSAMFDAADRGYRVMNISLGDVYNRKDDRETILAWTRVVREIIRKGAVIVASAGNDGVRLGGQTVHIPSDLSGVISVGATGIRPEPVYPQDGSYDVFAFYSNYGRPIDLVAQGGDYGSDDLINFPPNWYEFGILGAFVCPGCKFTADSSPVLGFTSYDPDPDCIAKASCQTDYSWFTGTSMAAPHVSAVAGLIFDRFPYFNNLFVSTILKTSAESLGNPSHFGSGMVDALQALGGR